MLLHMTAVAPVTAESQPNKLAPVARAWQLCMRGAQSYVLKYMLGPFLHQRACVLHN